VRGQCARDLAQALTIRRRTCRERSRHRPGIPCDRTLTLQNEKQVDWARTAVGNVFFGRRGCSIWIRGREWNRDPVGSFSRRRRETRTQTMESAWGRWPECASPSEEQRAELEKTNRASPSGSRLSLTGYCGGKQGLTPTTAFPIYQINGASTCRCFWAAGLRPSARAPRSRSARSRQEVDLRHSHRVEVEDVDRGTGQREQIQKKKNGRANLGVQLARQSVEQSRIRFQAGVRIMSKVIQAQDNWARGDDNKDRALYRSTQSRADLAMPRDRWRRSTPGNTSIPSGRLTRADHRGDRDVATLWKCWIPAWPTSRCRHCGQPFRERGGSHVGADLVPGSKRHILPMGGLVFDVRPGEALL